MDASSRVETVVANWYPRFIANGLDALDVRRTLDGIATWSDWAPRWTATADRYEALGRAAAADGHAVTAADHLRRAALTLQFAQFVLNDDPPRRRALQERQCALYRAAAPALRPPAERYELPEAGVVGYVRRPTGVARPGVVVLLPGLESTKEQFSTYEPYFLERGVATVSVEGPGQGEAGWKRPFRDADYGDAVAAVGVWLAERGDVDADRVVVLGTSFGGYLALRHATRVSGLAAVVDIAGPHDLADFAALQPVLREGFTALVGAEDEAEAARLLSDVRLDDTLPTLDVPVLVVHGERDRIIPVDHARRIAAALGDRATVRIEPDGNHSCNDLHTVVRPAVADWVADRLEETRTR